MTISIDEKPAPRRVWLECTSTSTSRYNTGIQRVARSLVAAAADLTSCACAPIVHNGRFFQEVDDFEPFLRRSARVDIAGPRRAFHRTRAWILRWMPAASPALHSQGLEYGLRRIVHAVDNAGRWLWALSVSRGRRIQFGTGDVLVLLDPAWAVDLSSELARARREGADIWLVVYDLIPLLFPDLAPEGTPILMEKWLRRTVPLAAGVLAISASVEADLRMQLQRMGLDRNLRIDHFYLGAGLGKIVHDDSQRARVSAHFAGHGAVYLMVGTIEPRKGHALVISAFERLWLSGSTSKLMIFGRLGWRSDAVAARIRHHPEFGTRLFWIDDGTDAELDFVYRRATALIFPSRCEGFGLPLVEAMLYGLPVFASDIPVFREIGGDYPRFVDIDTPEALDFALRQWEREFGPQAARRPRAWPTWSESANALIEKTNAAAAP